VSSLVSWYLDKYADRHKQRWGCANNRDLEGAIVQARIVPADGWDVVEEKRTHLGTTLVYVAEKKKVMPKPL
jgi:hypothetical protein